MIYSAGKYAEDPAGFRQHFAGEVATMIDGTEKPVEALTDEEIGGYKVDAVWRRRFNQWSTADKVVLTGAKIEKISFFYPPGRLADEDFPVGSMYLGELHGVCKAADNNGAEYEVRLLRKGRETGRPITLQYSFARNEKNREFILPEKTIKAINRLLEKIKYPGAMTCADFIKGVTI